MPTLSASCNAVAQVPTGLPNDVAWTVPFGALASADGLAASVDPSFVTGPGGVPSPPASAAQTVASQGAYLSLGFDLSGMPSGQTVTGIRLYVRRKKDAAAEGGSGLTDLNARLTLLGTPVGVAESSALQWPTAYDEALYTWTAGSGGVPSILSADVPGIGALFSAAATGGPVALPYLDDGRPRGYVDRARVEIDYVPFVPVATRPATRGPRRIPPYRHGL